MNKKNIIKFILDIAMAVLFITFFNKNLISFKFHIIGGYVFAAFILVHMILNKKWIINISKRLIYKYFFNNSKWGTYDESNNL